MKFGSLFSGIGGFDLGFERSGMECAWQCEIDPHAQEVLRTHFNKEIYDDVRNIGTRTKPVDLICGGFPCQDVSIAGRRAGLAGERSGLWFEFARIVKELKPRWVVVENVPGLLSSNGGRDFAVILQELVKFGYGVCWRVLDAQFFGVPQRRRRVFIVASLGNGNSAKVLFESEGLHGNPPARSQAGQETSRIAGTLSANGGGLDRPAGNANELDFCVPTVGLASANPTAPTIMANYGTKWGLGDQEAFSGDYHVLSSGQGNAAIEKNIVPSLTGLHESPVVAYNIQHNDGGEHKRKDRPNGGLYVNETETSLTVGTSDMTAIAYTPRRTSFDGQENLSPTLSAGGCGFGMPAIGVRRLTPTECERLQGFPDGWTDGQADTQRYKQLGNAVAVPVIEWLGKRILNADL